MQPLPATELTAYQTGWFRYWNQVDNLIRELDRDRPMEDARPIIEARKWENRPLDRDEMNQGFGCDKPWKKTWEKVEKKQIWLEENQQRRTFQQISSNSNYRH